MVLVVKNTPSSLGDIEMWVGSLGWEDPLEEEMATHSSIFPEESHGQSSLVGYSPRGHKECSENNEFPTVLSPHRRWPEKVPILV